VEIDGLYLDDVGYDRVIMQRTRKILDRERPRCLVDLHLVESLQRHGGMGELRESLHGAFPYVDTLWFGEGFDYNQTPDYWLVEMSGIPSACSAKCSRTVGIPGEGCSTE